MVEQDLKIKWEINFLTFWNTDWNAQKNENCNNIVFFKKSALKNDFGPREVLELKMLIRPTRHSQFEHFPRSKIIFESRFLKKYFIITILNVLKCFHQYLKDVIFQVISNFYVQRKKEKNGKYLYKFGGKLDKYGGNLKNKD